MVCDHPLINEGSHVAIIGKINNTRASAVSAITNGKAHFVIAIKSFPLILCATYNVNPTGGVILSILKIVIIITSTQRGSIKVGLYAALRITKITIT